MKYNHNLSKLNYKELMRLKEISNNVKKQLFEPFDNQNNIDLKLITFDMITKTKNASGESILTACNYDIHEDTQLMKFFNYDHLPENVQKISEPFYILAHDIYDSIPYSKSREDALRELLKSKDSAVRAAL